MMSFLTVVVYSLYFAVTLIVFCMDCLSCLWCFVIENCCLYINPAIKYSKIYS